MFCHQCGKAVADGAQFCGHCGATLGAASPPPVPPPAPPPADMRPSFDAPRAPAPRPPGAGAGFDANALARGLFARVKAILLTPRTEWPVIAAEPATSGGIYRNYVAPLAAIGVIATLIGHTVFGFSFFGRMPLGAGLVGAIVSYAMAFVGVFVTSWIVNALAPSFGGQKDNIAALKVTAYAFTAAWVAGVFSLIPALSFLGLLGLYALYLLYLGLPVLMRCPQEKSLGYTIVVVLCAIVVTIVFSMLSALLVGGMGFAHRGMMGGFGASSVDRKAQAADQAAGMLSSLLGGKTDADRERVAGAMKALEQMGERAEKAQKAAKPGDASGAVDATAALGAVGQIMAGGKDVQPVDFHKLKDMLPESVAGLKRSEASGQSNEAMGMKGSSATARYSDGANASMTIEITDMGSLAGLAGLAAKFDPSMEKETDTGYERTTKVDGALMHERYDRRAKSGEVDMMVANRFSVSVHGTGVDADAMKSALKEIDAGKLAAMSR